ncbi:MAG: TonB-dependent receptor [Bacteroidetes bacterium]|nr:TonB-dependent receptor [Bacteroidota bacterium]
MQRRAESQLFRSENQFRPISDFSGSSVLTQVYAQYQYKFTDNLTLNPGLHYQYFSFNSTYAVEPRLGLKWEYASNRSLNLGYGIHSQLLPINIYYRQTLMPDGTYRRLNQELSMLKSQHVILGHDWSINNNLRLKTEAYYQYIYGACVNKPEKTYFSLLNEGANFGMDTPDTLEAKGTGKNYGLELTFEHFLNKGLYYLITVSLYDSKYKGSDGVERNTAFNGNYVLNALVGKEFELGAGKSEARKARSILGFDLKTTWAGGQRYIPFATEPDPATNYTTYRQVFDYQHAYSKKFSDYYRTDLKITYRRNGKHITQEYALDIQNLFNSKNIYTERFNRKTGQKSFIYQTGLLVIPQYRIIF